MNDGGLKDNQKHFNNQVRLEYVSSTFNYDLAFQSRVQLVFTSKSKLPNRSALDRGQNTLMKLSRILLTNFSIFLLILSVKKI